MRSLQKFFVAQFRGLNLGIITHSIIDFIWMSILSVGVLFYLFGDLIITINVLSIVLKGDIYLPFFGRISGQQIAQLVSIAGTGVQVSFWLWAYKNRHKIVTAWIALLPVILDSLTDMMWPASIREKTLDVFPEGVDGWFIAISLIVALSSFFGEYVTMYLLSITGRQYKELRKWLEALHILISRVSIIAGTLILVILQVIFVTAFIGITLALKPDQLWPALVISILFIVFYLALWLDLCTSILGVTTKIWLKWDYIKLELVVFLSGVILVITAKVATSLVYPAEVPKTLPFGFWIVIANIALIVGVAPMLARAIISFTNKNSGFSELQLQRLSYRVVAGQLDLFKLSDIDQILADNLFNLIKERLEAEQSDPRLQEMFLRDLSGLLDKSKLQTDDPDLYEAYIEYAAEQERIANEI